VAEERVVPGRVDEHELREIQKLVQEEQSAFADYITVRELAFISHITPGRIYHALTYARLRPMSGIKRGPLWFINKTEALRWAAVVAQWEVNHWSQRLKKINRAQARLERGEPQLTPYKQVHHNFDRPPEGLRVYTYDEAAAAVDVSRTTIRSMILATGALSHVTRYTTEDRRQVLDADGVDAYANRPMLLTKAGKPDRRDRRRRTGNSEVA